MRTFAKAGINAAQYIASALLGYEHVMLQVFGSWYKRNSHSPIKEDNIITLELLAANLVMAESSSVYLLYMLLPLEYQAVLLHTFWSLHQTNMKSMKMLSSSPHHCHSDLEPPIHQSYRLGRVSHKAISVMTQICR